MVNFLNAFNKNQINQIINKELKQQISLQKENIKILLINKLNALKLLIQLTFATMINFKHVQLSRVKIDKYGVRVLDKKLYR